MAEKLGCRAIPHLLHSQGLLEESSHLDTQVVAPPRPPHPARRPRPLLRRERERHGGPPRAAWRRAGRSEWGSPKTRGHLQLQGQRDRGTAAPRASRGRRRAAGRSGAGARPQLHDSRAGWTPARGRKGPKWRPAPSGKGGLAAR